MLNISDLGSIPTPETVTAPELLCEQVRIFPLRLFCEQLIGFLFTLECALIVGVLQEDLGSGWGTRSLSKKRQSEDEESSSDP